MKPVSIRLLGRCEVISPLGDDQTAIGSKAVLLLARLALRPGQNHDRRRLAEQLWPDRGEVQALASLRQTLWILRKAMGEMDPPPIVSDRSIVRLDPGVADIDTLVFEQHVRSGTREDLEQAAEIYRGDYLAEIAADGTDTFDLLSVERQRLRDLCLSGFKSLAGLRAGFGDADGAIEIAQRALAIDPLQEDVHATIIRLHRDAGRLGLARSQYEACRDLLRRELDVEPSAEIEALRKSLSPPSTPPPRTVILPPPSVIEENERSEPAARAEPHPANRNHWRLAVLVPGLAVAAVLLLVLSWFQTWRSPLPLHGAVAETRPSLVVLPFRDLSGGGTQDLSAAGLSDHLITDLSRIAGLSVIAPETSRSVSALDVPPQQLAAKLGVGYAVTGALETSQAGVVVVAQMVEASSGATVWTKHYDWKGGEPFAIQDDMVRRITGVLGIELSDRERRTIDNVPTLNLEALDFYHRAEHQPVGMNAADSLRRSLAAYRRAFELDPNFADAYAGYARTAVTIWRRDVSEIMSSAVARNEAYAAAGKAMRIDPENARAYEVLSIIQAVEGEHQIAVNSARQAVTFRPGDAEAHTNLAAVLFIAGDIEGAAAEVDIARRLNPALPAELRLISAMVAFGQHHYPAAIAEFTAVQEVMPRSEQVLEHLAAAYAYLGDLAQAKAIAAELKDIVPIANLGFYATLNQNIGTPEQTAHFIEGLRRAGIPEWPFDDRRSPDDRLSREELLSVAAGPVWKGKLANGVEFVQYFDRGGAFAYSSSTSLLTGHVEIRGNQLCQVIDGYLLNHASCGYVYRTAEADRLPATLAYVSIDAVKYFSVSQ